MVHRELLDARDGDMRENVHVCMFGRASLCGKRNGVVRNSACHFVAVKTGRPDFHAVGIRMDFVECIAPVIGENAAFCFLESLVVEFLVCFGDRDACSKNERTFLRNAGDWRNESFDKDRVWTTDN